MAFGNSSHVDHLFLKGGGNMGNLIRQKDWTLTGLGDPGNWSSTLKSIVATVLASPFPLHITWGKDFIQLYNDGYRPILGSEKHPNALGTPIFISYPEIWKQVGPLFHMVMEGQSVRHTDYELVLNRNGYDEICYFDFAYSPIIDEKGNIVGVLTNVIETTTKRNSELEIKKLTEDLNAINEELTASNEELTQSNEELLFAQETLKKTYDQLLESDTSLRLAIEAADFGVWHIHSITRDFITTQRLRDFFGLGHLEKITIEQAVMQIREDFRVYVVNTLENAIYNNGDYDVTYPVIGLSDNKLRWLRAMGKLRADPSGDFSDFTGVVMDISNLKEDEERKNNFIGMVSHELKTPLTSIKAYLDLLQNQVRKQNLISIQRPVDRSVIQVKKMVSMVNGFLDLSRYDSAQIQLQFQETNVCEMLEDIVNEYTEHTTTHKLLLSADENLQVNADPDKLAQVVTNLIGNAMKYSPPSSLIEIVAEAKNNNAIISVRDQGVGIGERDQLKLFERYYRGEHHETIAGFGLGLYISSEIIIRHHGKIWVESKQGKGSTFYFTIPLSELLLSKK